MIEGITYFVCAVVIAMFGVGAYRLLRMKRLFQSPVLPKGSEDVSLLPSVSVCIPARNEGHAMTDNLDRVIASTYPKLEMIVLDDDSGDKTSSLIKAFAHDGVRFVEGSALPKDWLGKNHSLSELLREASGEYVLFMDVDTRIAPDTISRLVAYAQYEKADMVSVLPRREDGVRLSTLFSPLRYFWELIFHSKSRPAVASSAWLVRRESLLAAGGFESLKAVIQPEAVLAKQWSLGQESKYRFLIGTSELGVSYEKKWSSQRDTSTRLLFPLLGSRVHRSIVATLDLLVLVSPVALLVVGMIIDADALVFAGAAVYAAGVVLFALYYVQVWQAGVMLGAMLWPVTVTQEAWLVIRSTLRYKQRRVSWKGRSVAITTKE